MSEAITAPPLAYFAIEGRAVSELAICLQAMPILLRAPRGDGHGVLVLPGFTASDRSTFLLRHYLKRLGYDAVGWRLGQNTGPSDRLEAAMIRRLRSLFWRTGGKVSIVGWSLGGIYARELARQQPDMVRQVVTLGSPFAGGPAASNIGKLFELVSGEKIEDIQRNRLQDMKQPPPVPSTAVYSETDGVVAWRACLEEELPSTDNVRVPGSHCGLGHNPWALWVVADRLQQDAESWQPFKRSGLKKIVFPTSR